jgi:predicted dehydrogenase
MAELEPLVRLLVVGLGRAFERFHLPALLDSTEVRLVAAWDQDHERCAWGREHLPGVPVAYDLEELLAQRADALLLLTPVESHPALAVAALRAGLHVLVEQPMAPDPARATQMADAARAARRRLQIGFTRRFREPYRRLKSRLPSIDSRADIAFELVLPGTDAPVDAVLPQQADLLRWLLGASPGRLQMTAHAADWLECELEFPAGVRAHCSAGRGAYREWLAVSLAGIAYAASGTVFREGVNAASERSQQLAFLADKAAFGAARLLGRPDATDRSFEAQLRDFVSAVRGRATMGAGPADGLAALAVAEAGRKSAASGTWEQVG